MNKRMNVKPITIEAIYKQDRANNGSRYISISRNVAKRLCNGLLPRKGNEKVIGEIDGCTVYLRNIAGYFDVWVYYPVNRRY